eukprot:Gb_09498 [translate_table: standard]
MKMPGLWIPVGLYLIQSSPVAPEVIIRQALGDYSAVDELNIYFHKPIGRANDGSQYRPTKIPLQSVRPFEFTEVILKDEPDLDPNDQTAVLEHLDKVVRDMILRAEGKTVSRPELKIPLVRIKSVLAPILHLFIANHHTVEIVVEMLDNSWEFHFHLSSFGAEPIPPFMHPAFSPSSPHIVSCPILVKVSTLFHGIS